MSFNWGAFLGAAGNSAINTMDKLEAIELQKLQRERLERQVADEEGFRKANQEVESSQYNGGTAIPVLTDQALSSDKFTPEQKQQLGQDLAAMPPEQAKAALGALSTTGHTNEGYDFSKIGVYQGKDGQMLGTNDYTPIDPSKRSAMVLDRMLKEGNLYGIEKSLMLNKGLREFELNKKWDDFTGGLKDTQVKLNQTITNHGLAAVPDAINEDLKPYKMHVKFVGDKNGPGSLALYEGDKFVKRFTNGDEVMGAVTQAKFSLFNNELVGMLGSVNDALNFMEKRYSAQQKDREIGIAAANAASLADYRKSDIALRGNIHNWNVTKDNRDHERLLRNDEYTNNYTAAGTEKITAETARNNAPVLAGNTQDGRPIMRDPTNGRLSLDDGTPLPPDTQIYDIGTRPAPPAMVQQINAVAESLVESKQINPDTNKPFTLAEARAAAPAIIKGRDIEARHLETFDKLVEAGLKPGTPEFKEAYSLRMNRSPARTETDSKLDGVTTLNTDGSGSTQNTSDANKPNGSSDAPKSAIPMTPSQSVWNAKNVDRENNKGPRSLYNNEAESDRMGQLYLAARQLEVQKTQLEVAAQRKGVPAAERKEYLRQIDAIQGQLNDVNRELMRVPKAGPLHRNAPPPQR